MRMFAFAARNRKEIARDPLTLCFGIGMPLLMLGIVQIINMAIGNAQHTPSNFQMVNFTPATAVFAFSFITLFTAALISKDRATSILTRLFASPLTRRDYLEGYSLPLIPMAMAQSALTLIASLFLGLPASWGVLWCWLVLIPLSLLFIGLGMLFGIAFGDKQVSFVTSLLIQVAALSSGMWFDLKMIGGALEKVCYCLPYAHALDICKAAMAGDLSGTLVNWLVVAGYTLAAYIGASLLLKKRMKG